MPVKRHPVAVSKSRDPLAMVPLDTALVARLRKTYEQVRASDLRLAEIFYAKLFALAPYLRERFRSEPRAQAQKLIMALDTVVLNMESPAENAAMLCAMGKRHAEYSATPEHYDLVIGLLIDSMGEVLEGAVARDRLEEWRMAFRLISDQMIAGAGHDDRRRQ